MNNWNRAVLLAAGCLALSAAAQVYKYTDKDGKVQYTDQPPQEGAKTEVKIEKGGEPVKRTGEDWREKERALNQRLSEKRRDQDRCVRAKDFLQAFAKHLETRPKERVYINGVLITPQMVDDKRREVRDYCAPG